MKKKLFLSIAVAIGLGACSSNESLETQSSEGVNFGVFVGKTTKASVGDLVGLKTDGFKVLASNTGSSDWATAGSTTAPNFFYDKSVNWASTINAWTYSPLKLWPTNEDKITFFAFSPSTANVTLSAASQTGAPSITYVNPDVNASQIDLVADMLPDLVDTSNSDKVSFAFDHILSKIGFSAKLSTCYPGLTSLTVTSLKVYYAANSIQNSRVYTFSTDNSQSSIWADLATPTYHPEAVSDSGDEVIGTGVDLNNDATPTVSTLNDATKYIMMIPQDVLVDKVYAWVTYEILTGGVKTTKTEKVNFPAVTWLPGKQYTYNLNISITAITFDAITVNDWSDGTAPADVSVQ